MKERNCAFCGERSCSCLSESEFCRNCGHWSGTCSCGNFEPRDIVPEDEPELSAD